MIFDVENSDVVAGYIYSGAINYVSEKYFAKKLRKAIGPLSNESKFIFNSILKYCSTNFQEAVINNVVVSFPLSDLTTIESDYFKMKISELCLARIELTVDFGNGDSISEDSGMFGTVMINDENIYITIFGRYIKHFKRFYESNKEGIPIRETRTTKSDYL